MHSSNHCPEPSYTETLEPLVMRWRSNGLESVQGTKSKIIPGCSYLWSIGD